jgi:hypothetical protein
VSQVTRRLFHCSSKILCRFKLRKVESVVSVQTALSCVQTPIHVEKLLNSSRLHPFGRHGNTPGCSSGFEKIPVFICKHGLGRQHAPIQTRSLIRKLHANNLHPSGLQGNTVRTQSLIRQLRSDILQLSEL